MLHITNGSSVSLAIPDEIVYWEDVLHEGPVPAALELDQLSKVRGQFLSNYFNQPVSFTGRDTSLRRFHDHDEVVLWFEHDLYDQLHLLQLLDWFSRQEVGRTRLSLISIDRYLGSLRPEELARLFPDRRPVSAAQLRTAQIAWQAFRAPDPTAIVSLLTADTGALPFLRAALFRHLEQFPGPRDGLSRTEHQVLQMLASGPRKFLDLFFEDQKLEPAIFMGDIVYKQYLRELQHASHPLLMDSDVGWELTDLGRRVLAGRADHVKINGINRWRGGVHLCAGAPVWGWDSSSRNVVP